ncbi:2687_t:CDS:2 [Funneliformis geosporum]|nr:2687_t:CDS:2 [Funneliformis geosporum]
MGKDTEGSEPNIHDPYAYHRPHFIRWKGSVIKKVLPSTMVITIVAIIVTVVHLNTPIKMGIQQSFITVLSFVVGLLLTYRTNTAYDRKLWSTITVAIRSLTRNIWINIKQVDTNSRDIVEKVSAINLLSAFAFATKHYLREDPPSEYIDLKRFISNIKSDLPGFEPIEEQDLRDNIKKYGPSFINRLKKSHLTPAPENYNLPLTITLYLGAYLEDKVRQKKIDVPTNNVMHASLNSLVDSLTSLERILRTPIPLAYSIHLIQTVWIYCLSLPFQLVVRFEYATIPIVFLASLVLIGIEQIGSEIENPFGHDANDLKLDDFCKLIELELDTIISNPRQSVNDLVYTEKNRPFGPNGISASDARKLSTEDVRTRLSYTSELEIQIPSIPSNQ